MTRAERRVAVLADFVRYFGPRAAVPLEYREYSWGRTPSRAVPWGCLVPRPLDCLWPCPAGAHRGPALGRAETAAVWHGTMEGALWAGARAAAEVLAALG